MQYKQTIQAVLQHENTSVNNPPECMCWQLALVLVFVLQVKKAPGAGKA